jgi:hypothetical protein
MCTEKGCKKQGIYGFDYKKPLYCSKHRKDDTENVVNKRCEYDGCKKQPRFGIDKIKFCAMHKTNNMINLKERLCTERLCVTRPNYGYKGKKAIYCTKHKKINMVDVKHKICQEGECMTVANSGYLYRNPTHCARHRKPDMTDVTHKKCLEDNCIILPSYGYAKNKAFYCVNHKKDDMFNVTGFICKSCKKLASYGYKIPEYCISHKEKDMVDCRSKKCKIENCYTQPLYGILTATHCAKHKESGMKDLKTRKCQEKDCQIRAGFGINIPLYCSSHKKDKMTNLVDPKCVSCNLFVVPNKRSMCWYCKPSDTKHRRSNEHDLAEFFKNNIDIPFQHNKSVGKVCGSFRPDFVFDLNTHFVVIECDEDQHKQYDEMCEIIRMYNIYQSLGLPVHFLRYNPDKFKLNNVNISVRKKERLNVLKHIFSEKIQKIPNNITATKLFYDGNDGFISNMDVDKVIQIGTKD